MKNIHEQSHVAGVECSGRSISRGSFIEKLDKDLGIHVIAVKSAGGPFPVSIYLERSVAGVCHPLSP